jgi:mRNA-degrading endonuclease RelE of RelBE toxin-antitoxin system
VSLQIIWFKKALDFLRKLNDFESDRIIKKINSIKELPERYLFSLVNRKENKIRIGDYRLFADYNPKENKLTIYSIRHRKNAYKK